MIARILISMTALALASLACTKSQPEVSGVASEEAAPVDEESMEEDAAEGDSVQALPDEEEEGQGGGIISGGVKPDDGNPHCDWLVPKKGDPKGTSLYGCRSSQTMAMKELLSAKLLNAKGDPVTIIERHANHRGFDIVFVVRTDSDQTLKLSN